MKRCTVLLLILIGIGLIVSACATVADISPEEHARQVTCSQVIVIPVFDLDGNLITKFVSGELKSHYEYDAGEGIYYRYPDNIEQWNDYYGRIDADIESANAQLAKLYVQSGFIQGVSFNKQGLEDGQSLDSTNTVDLYPCPVSDDPNQTDYSWYEGISPLFNRSCDAETKSRYYCTDITVVGGTTYVTVSTPGGSSVSYAHPTEWLNQIMWGSFSDGELLDFHPQFSSNDVRPDSQEYGESFLSTFVGNGDSLEVATFTLIVSDFQGRNELRPVIARAMEIAAVQTGHPVVMIFDGMVGSGQHVRANISAHQDGVEVNGWMALSFGSVTGGGGEMNLDANYTSYSEDLIRGSIYITNP